MYIRPVRIDDSAAWLSMRQALWPEDDSGSHAREIAQFFAGTLHTPLAVLIGMSDSGAAVAGEYPMVIVLAFFEIFQDWATGLPSVSIKPFTVCDARPPTKGM